MYKQPEAMEPTKEIETVLIRAKQYVIFLWSTIFGGGALTTVFSVETNSLVVAYIGLALFLLGPAVFNKQLRSFFTKKARVQFFGDRLIVEICNQDTDASESTDELSFADLAAFRTGDASRDNSSYMALRLKDGRKYYYTFVEQEKDDAVIPTLEAYIRGYNASPERDHTIVYLPPMLATEAGKYVFIGLTVLVIGCVIIQLIVKPNTIPYSVGGGVLLYLILLAVRKSDMAKAKAMNG